MKIAIITGSPHKNGTSALLADEFIRGAEESGHDVFRFDSAFEKAAPCLGCNRCRLDGAKYVKKDAMEKLNPELLAADVVVFVTPLYYYGMSSQLKTVIDRFYAINSKLIGSGKKAILLASAHDANDWTMRALVSHYETVLKYLEWNDAGILLATGCGTRSDIERTDYPAQACRMGKELSK